MLEPVGALLGQPDRSTITVETYVFDYALLRADRRAILQLVLGKVELWDFMLILDLLNRFRQVGIHRRVSRRQDRR